MVGETRMRKSAPIFSVVAAVMLSGAVTHADPQSPAPSPPPGTPKCVDFRRPAAAVAQPAVRMDDGWQAMDSAATTTRTVKRYDPITGGPG